MNIVILHGRIARDPDVRTTPGGKKYCRFPLAVDRYARKGEARQADFPSCTAWEKTADFIEQYFPKGKEILLHGRITTGSYEAQDGTKRYTTEVTVDRVEFCGSNGGNKSTTEEAAPPPPPDGNTVDDDDIPF